MKNIKKFKELNSATYKSAADKMKSLGLNKRADKLDRYSDEIKGQEEYNDYIRDAIKFKKYGTFEIEYENKKYEVFAVFSEKWYDDYGYDFHIRCSLYGDQDFFEKVKYSIPFFYLMGDDYGFNEIEFVSNFTITNKIKIDRRNAIKLKNITISYFNDSYEDDPREETLHLIDSLKKMSINEFYRETTNEELKPSTYVSAAEKLLKKHPKRYRKLIDHAEKVELDENKLKHKTKLGYMDSNRFNIAVENYTYNSSSYNKSIEKYKNCALYIYFDYKENEYYLNEAECDVESGISSRGVIEFYLKFIPESYEDYIKLNDSEASYASYLYFYYNITKGSLELDENITLSNFIFTDRASSGRFLQIIKSIFDKKVKYGNDYSKDLAYDIEYNFLAGTGVSSEYGLTMDDFIKVINKTSANKLYKEV